MAYHQKHPYLASIWYIIKYKLHELLMYPRLNRKRLETEQKSVRKEEGGNA